MAIIRKTKKGSLDIRSEFEKFLDKFWEEWTSPLSIFETYSSPKIDIYEDEKEIVVKADIPGVSEKDIDVSIEDNTLTIKATRSEQKEEKGKNYIVSERYYGTFSRSIALPKEVDTEKAKATYKKGVLTIRLPKVESEKTKKIEVKVE